MTLLAHCLARRFLRALQRLADEFGVAVVITNQVGALHTKRLAGRLGMEGAGWIGGRKEGLGAGASCGGLSDP